MAGRNRTRPNEDEHRLFGQRAVQRGLVTEEDILEALRVQYQAKVLLGKHLFLGEILLLNGKLTPKQLSGLLRETGAFHEEPEDVHGKRFFGDVAIQLGFVTPAQVYDALNTQWEEDNRGDRHRLIGEILFQKGHLSEDQVDRVVKAMVTELQELPAGEKE